MLVKAVAKQAAHFQICLDIEAGGAVAHNQAGACRAVIGANCGRKHPNMWERANWLVWCCFDAGFGLVLLAVDPTYGGIVARLQQFRGKKRPVVLA